MARAKRRGIRLQVMLSSDELAALNDWRFAMHMPSRAAAIRELLRRGLAGASRGINTQERPRGRSSGARSR